MVTAAQLQLLHSPIVSLIPSVSSSTYVKLDETNYLPWHFLMKMMLQGHGIMGFIDGSNPCPPQDVATSTHSVITSESSARPELDEFKVWKMHDHALMLLLTATLSSSAISCVIGSKSSQEMWVRLQDEFFLPVTRTSIIKLKTDMYNMKKGSDSVSQYLRRLKEVRDGLSILGVTFPDEDFVVFALNGLPPKYNTFKCVLRGRENIISLKDFRAQLLAEETIVDCSADWNPDFAFISAQEKQEEERTFDASLTGDLGGIHHSDSNGLAPSARNLGFLGHALKHSHGFRHDRSRLHQVQGTNNEEADPSRRDLDAQQITAMAGQQSIYGHNKDGELNSPSAHKLSPLGNSNATNFLTDVREGLSVKTSSESAFQAQGMVAFGESDSQSPTIGNDVLPNYAETSQPNLSMASNWFKQYGTFRNGQMQPTYDARLARSSVGQTSLVKPSQSLNIHSSVEQIDASDANRVWPSTATNLVTSEPFVAPYVLPSDVIDETMAIVRPKKRKIETSELLPWHKVTEGSKRVQDVSLAEQEWALSCNRLTEKVGHEFEMIEDGRPILRSKRRLIFTTQFLQQLLGPAPASILSADAALYYDSVTYFVAKLSLRDACTLTCSSSTDAPLNDSNTIGEKPKVSENTEMQYLSKAVEDFTNRLKKLENDLLRLDKVSILDLRLECQELERFSVINRFARFHIPQTATSGTTSSSGTVPTAPKPFPQRYVTGQPLPRHLPEGVHCLSL